MRVFTVLIFFFFTFLAWSQSARQINREGVEYYNNGEYESAEKSYNKAIKQNKELIEASYNLALTYYRQRDYQQAIKQMKNLLLKALDKEVLSKVYYNLGNSYLQVNQLRESVEAYENSLRINPNDENARYNLTYALLKLKARQKNQQENTKNLMDKIEQEERFSQQFMRRNKNKGKEVKNW